MATPEISVPLSSGDEVKRFTVKTASSKEMEQECLKNALSTLLAMMIIGICGLLFYVVYGVACVPEGADSPWWLDVLLWVFAVFFAIGLVFRITFKKEIKKADESPKVCEYSFYDTFFTVIVSETNDATTTMKCYYKKITRLVETKNYYFIYSKNVYLGAWGVAKVVLKKDEEDFLVAKCTPEKQKRA